MRPAPPASRCCAGVPRHPARRRRNSIEQSFTLSSEGKHMATPIIDPIRAYHDDLTAWRRDIHAHPELGFEEKRTSDLVAGKLAEFGIEVHRGLGKTGI